MEFDWTVKITDIVMILAIIAGPIIAVQITEYLRGSKDARMRRVHLFRTLMATRSATLVASHIESLNLVEIEFHSSQRQDRRVIDCWKLYLAHLNDRNYPKDAWGARRADLLIDLLYEMSVSLGYSYDKSQIKSGTYYPHGYEDADSDNWETRKLWLEVLRGNRPLAMRAEVYPSHPHQQSKDDPAPP